MYEKKTRVNSRSLLLRRADRFDADCDRTRDADQYHRFAAQIGLVDARLGARSHRRRNAIDIDGISATSHIYAGTRFPCDERGELKY